MWIYRWKERQKFKINLSPKLEEFSSHINKKTKLQKSV